MYTKYTAKDLMKKARSVALLKSFKEYPTGKFKHLDHVIIVDEDGGGTYLRVKLERSFKGSNTKEVAYEDEYL